jgi:hypothetical protein
MKTKRSSYQVLLKKNRELRGDIEALMGWKGYMAKVQVEVRMNMEKDQETQLLFGTPGYRT